MNKRLRTNHNSVQCVLLKTLYIALQCLLLGSATSVSVYAGDELSLKQKILMPGPLVAGHADIETECSSCHTSFSKSDLSQRCLNCHEDIAADRNSKSGFHGQSPLAKAEGCETCHGDHEGRDADIIGLSKESFNHSHTRFALEGVHRTLECTSCHTKDSRIRDTGSACVDCHQKHDLHKGALGEQCESCHQATAWQSLKPFEHSQTNFPLLGKHQELECSSCHIAQQFKFEDNSCHACHKTADVHQGANGTDCASCHSEKSWKQVNFDHSTTDFALLGQHAEIPCSACHLSGQERKQTPSECNSCHANDDIHLARNGDQCQDCHNTVEWKKITFNHSFDTGFPLDGKHREVNCRQCHTGAIHDNLPRDCASCHVADDIHNNADMKVCGTCHSTQGWNLVSRFDHDFTAFPLIGMHQIVPCESCHIGNQFAGTDTQCTSCHSSMDIHKQSLGSNCAECHTPNAWNIWQFDHAKSTGYELLGKHVNLSCDSCHKPGSKAGATTTICGNCHQREDIHGGEFGKDCGSCHVTENFFELMFQ